MHLCIICRRHFSASFFKLSLALLCIGFLNTHVGAQAIEDYSLRTPNSIELQSLQQEVAKGVRCYQSSVCEIDRSLFEKTERSSEQLSQYLRLVPFRAQGRLKGLRLYSALPSSLLGKLLLQDGDIFRSINGFDFTNPLSALGGYIQLRLASQFKVLIERNGKLLHFSYTLR